MDKDFQLWKFMSFLSKVSAMSTFVRVIIYTCFFHVDLIHVSFNQNGNVSANFLIRIHQNCHNISLQYHSMDCWLLLWIMPWHQTSDKQRVLMHRHQRWNVRHGLCHIYMRYIYIWVVYSFCLFCCLFIIVTWWYIWCIVWQVASKRKYRHVW